MVRKEINENWKFHLGECEEAWFKGYDDSGWETVMAPHDWSVTKPFSEEYSSGTGYLCGGIGWYRLHFFLPEESREKRVRIIFDGVYKNSQVWCNSYYLGKRPNGYVPFSYDLTPFLNYGGTDNVISVKVTHTDLADSRWFTGSGLTRKVSLMIEEPVHPQEYGVFFQTNRADEEQAAVTVEHEIVNTWDHSVRLSVETMLLDWQKNRVMDETAQLCLEAGEKRKLSVETAVIRPELWSPENPKRYDLLTYYQVDGGEPYLAHQEKVGIRTFRFDADRGFFLNGREMKLKGVCVHHDGGCLGAAMKREVWERRLEILKDCGCNAIRCSHNPHMPELYELCDAMGFLVIDEAFDEWENAKNKWSAGHNVYPPRHQGYYEDFPQWHEVDLRAMVRRDRNHPCVILWSIGNEIDYPNDPYCHPMFQTMTGNNDADKPAEEREYSPDRPNAERLPVLAGRLASIVKQEDTTRPVTLAAAFPELSSHLGFFAPLDVIGYNYKEHLYEKDHGRFPDKPLMGSENGHSYEAWLAVKNHPYISGQFLWTGIDYLGEARGWPIHGSAAGLLSCAGYRKPEFYKRKSFWSKEPVLRLATRKKARAGESDFPVLESWNYEEGDMVTVICYSNFPKVALALNGSFAGCQTEYTADGTYCFTVPYKPGVITATAYDSEGAVRRVETLKTCDKAEKIVCRLWKGHGDDEADAFDESSHAVGYLYQLEINLSDQNGLIPAWDDQQILIRVTGDGEAAGLENGDLSDTTPYSENQRRTYQGRLMAYIRRIGTGTICVELQSDPDGCGTVKLEII